MTSGTPALGPTVGRAPDHHHVSFPHVLRPLKGAGVGDRHRYAPRRAFGDAVAQQSLRARRDINTSAHFRARIFFSWVHHIFDSLQRGSRD